MGSPDFGIPTLERLHQNYQIAGVVTQPDRPAGRGRKLHPPVVKSKAIDLNLPLMQPDRLSNLEAMEQLHDYLNQMHLQGLVGKLMCYLIFAGGALVVVGATRQTWRKRRKIFAFAYR